MLNRLTIPTGVARAITPADLPPK
ncbi:MAG: hypothetical protein RLZZ215_1628, partial [Pseudomonadota bacterium]